MRKIALLLVLALALGALMVAPVVAQEEGGLPEFIQHTECEVDLTGETITIYHFGDISGAYAFITQPLLAGLADAAAYYNAAGGICGATIASDNRDTGGDLAQTQAHYDYYSSLEDTPDLLVLYASGDAELLRSQVAEDEIPVVISAGSVEGLYGEEGNEPGWIFATNPLYADQFGAFCEYVADNPERYPEPSIGYISWPGAFGEAAFTPETTAYCESLGVNVIDTPEYFLPTATDISGQVLNLIDAGATILYTNTLASGPAVVAATVVEQGYEDEIELAGVNWVLDTSAGLFAAGLTLGSDGLPAVNGMVGSLPFAWWTETDLPGIQLIREQAELNERTLPTQNISYLLGWSTVDYYTELYIRAVNEAGSLDAVDGALMKSTIENTVYSPLALYDVDFRGGELRALPTLRMAQIAYLNAEQAGPATSGEDALQIPRDDGTTLFVPILIPLTEPFEAPDLRPGMMAEGE